jgi:hypothetical protein
MDPDRRGGSCQPRFAGSCPTHWRTDWTGQYSAGELATSPTPARAATSGTGSSVVTPGLTQPLTSSQLNSIGSNPKEGPERPAQPEGPLR